MNEMLVLKCCRDNTTGTEINAFIPDKHIAELLVRKRISKAEIRFDDGRHISAEQRKKAYATIRDIADYTGNPPEIEKQYRKYHYVELTGEEEPSLKDCSMDTAREFINTLMEFAIENGIPLTGSGIERTDDIGKYLYFCIIHKKCAVCGRPGEIHHEDAVGMGNDRRKVDDSNYKKICLCRFHHTIAHQKGVIEFRKAYKVYGIVVKDFG